jgi:hypothetical protein
MSLRLEGVGAAVAAVSSAVGALAGLPVLFGVAAILAVAATVSYFSKRDRGDRTAADAQGEIKTGERAAAGAAVISR